MSACGSGGEIPGEGGSGCSAASPFALQVLGDSMEPEFKHGCVIVIDPEGVVRHECYVMAEHNGENTFRQLRIQEERYFLAPLNDQYETVEITGLDVIKGVIVQQAGRRRADRKFY